MRLSKCDPQATGTVTCFKCGTALALHLATADLDGPAFKAYYCPSCVVALTSRPVKYLRDDDEPRFAHQVERQPVDDDVDKAYAEYYYGTKEED